MITNKDIKVVDDIKAMINTLVFPENNDCDVDWEKVGWISLLEKMVANLQIAKYCYDKSMVVDNPKYYYCECVNCGWNGSSEFLNGGLGLGDTGDYGDTYCPVCDSNNITSIN